MEEKKTQPRKAYRKHGEEGERPKMISFKLDAHLLKWLAKQANKGRYLNNLIERDRTRWYREHRDDDDFPDSLNTDDLRRESLTDYQS